MLQRAGRLVGPLKAATRTVREPLLEPWSGELDVEATVENLLGKPHPEPGDLIVQRRVDRRHQVVLMVDTSLSMAGEKMALAAVATAVLALKLRPGDLAVVLFADGARAVSRFGEEVAPAELVRRMLAVPCGGGTDIAAALQAGHAELQRGRDPGAQRPAGERRRVHERRRPAAGGGAVRAAARAPHGGAGGGPRPRRAGDQLDRAAPARRRGHRPRRRRWSRACRRLPGAAAPDARGRRSGAAMRRPATPADLVSRAPATGANAAAVLRPGLAGCGIDVLATSVNAGWPLEVVAAEGEPYHRYALILVE